MIIFSEFHGFDEEFASAHEREYKAVFMQAALLWKEVLENGGSPEAARGLARQFIHSHPLLNPIAALGLERSSIF